MLTGTRARLSILAPTRDDLIARVKTAKISATKAEFADTSAYDLDDNKTVVPASIDIHGGRVISRILAEEDGRFTNVKGKGAFNGFALTFDALTDDRHAEIIDAELVENQTTSGIKAKSVSFDADTLFVNLDDLPFSFGDTVTVRLGFALTGTTKADKLAGYDGRDQIFGGDGADRLRGNRGDDLISGGDGRDRLLGGSGHDTLRGGDGDDVIKAGPGFDRLLGGKGADTLAGAGGEDQFVFHAVHESRPTARDTILDFVVGEDRINLSRIDANEHAHGNQAFRFIGDHQFSGKAGELRASHDGSGTHVTADTDGDGHADLSILLEGSPTLAPGDFIL